MSISVMIAQPENGGHVWLAYETHHQRILRLLAAGDDVHSGAMRVEIDVLSPVVFTSARSLLGRGHSTCFRQEASDAAQEWWAVMFDKGFGRCRPGFPAHRFTYRVLQNICANFVRGKPRHRGIPAGYEASDARFNPLRATIRKERGDRVWQATKSLADDLCDAVISQFENGESGEVAASRLGISQNAVYMRRYHAKNALREKLGDLND